MKCIFLWINNAPIWMILQNSYTILSFDAVCVVQLCYKNMKQKNIQGDYLYTCSCNSWHLIPNSVMAKYDDWSKDIFLAASCKISLCFMFNHPYKLKRNNSHILHVYIVIRAELISIENIQDIRFPNDSRNNSESFILIPEGFVVERSNNTGE